MARKNSGSHFVLMLVLVTVESVDQLLKIENADEAAPRTLGTIVGDEVQSNLESLWYVRQARVKVFRQEAIDA